MPLTITDEIVRRIQSIIKWHRNEIEVKNPEILLIPERDVWKSWDDNRLWCSFFFSIISPGGSSNARKYLKLIEDNKIEFELNPAQLSNMPRIRRIDSIWKFGTGDNIIEKRLGRFFSKPDNIGCDGSLEDRVNDTFEKLNDRGFIKWFNQIDKLEGERSKAKELEILSGSKILKVSRDFLNNLGMTKTLIPLDVHILTEMRKNWMWNVPKSTPSNRDKYENIENIVRKIAKDLGITVVEIDKAIVSYRITRHS